MSIGFHTGAVTENTALQWFQASAALANADIDTVNAAVNRIQQENNVTRVEAVAVYLFNQISFINLIFELMKLSIHDDELERVGRSLERKQLIFHMEKVVANFKDQAKWLLGAGIGSGVLGILGGALPIIGHMKGDAILGKLQGWFTSLQGMSRVKFFNSISKMLQASSEVSKVSGQIHNTQAEGDRHFDDTLGRIAETEEREATRRREELQRKWQTLENCILEAIRMSWENNKATYNL